MYFLKFMRFAAAWMAVYIARRFFSDDYVNSTIFSNDPPKHLTTMVTTFLYVHLILEAFIVCVVLLVSAIRLDDGTPLMPSFSDLKFITIYAVDVVCTLAMLLTMTVVVARVIGNRKVFQYVDQGTRAARALEEITVNLAAVTFLLPFFLLV